MVKRRQPTGISPSADEVAVIGQNNGREDYVDTSKLDRRFYQRTKKDAFMLSFVVATFFHICYTFIGGISNRQPVHVHRKNLAAEAATLSRERLRAAADAIAKKRINNIFIAVKTTQANHQSRLPSILNSWGEFVPKDIAFFTDPSLASNMPLRNMTDPMLDSPTQQRFNLINTNCPEGHTQQGLCCKTSAEIQYFYSILQRDRTKYQWFCGVDDDTFVNFPALKEYLKEYEAKDGDELGEYFIGHSPTKFPTSRGRRVKSFKEKTEGKDYHMVEYGTGGAGWCLSANLVERGIDNFRRLVETCADIAYHDDVTLGYVVQVELGVKMIKERRMHSHLDTQVFASQKEAMDQITFGSGKRGGKLSFVAFPGFKLNPSSGGEFVSDVKDDPLGFRALYCNFWPKRCPQQQASTKGKRDVKVQIKQKEIPGRNFTNWQLKEEEQKEQLRAFREKRRKDGYKFRIKVN